MGDVYSEAESAAEEFCAPWKVRKITIDQKTCKLSTDLGAKFCHEGKKLTCNYDFTCDIDSPAYDNVEADELNEY